MKRLLITLIKIYQKTISPEKGVFVRSKLTCRFQPTCSEYFIDALEKHNALKACWLGSKRILRCHPWGGHGYDPVPLANLNKKNDY